MGKIALQILLVGVSSLWVFAQARGKSIDFFNERLKIPDSELFIEAEYIDSEIGLRFGIDKRLSYFPGQYEEAAEAFEAAIQAYRFKAEIWVYLIRSYYHLRNPERARDTLEEAAETMPDLRRDFWDPLLESMLAEIRKRADDLQTQVVFYTKTPGDFLALFRLYKFLQDYQAGAGVISLAADQSEKMHSLAKTAIGENLKAYRSEAAKWDSLVFKLKNELAVLGVEVSPSPTPDLVPLTPSDTTRDPQLVANTRLLQMKIDYYPSELGDYRQLFDNYIKLKMAERAQGVVVALNREINRVGFLAETATDVVQEDQFLADIDSLAALREQLKMKIATGGEL